MIIELILYYLTVIGTIVIDLAIFVQISNVVKNRIDYLFLTFFALVVVCIVSFVPSSFALNISLTIGEVMGLYLYFSLFRKENKKLIIGSCLIWSLLDLTFVIVGIMITTIFHEALTNQMEYILNLTVDIIGIVLVLKYKNKVQSLLDDNNSNVFLGVLLYIWITGVAVCYFISADKQTTEIVQFSIGLLVFQTIFAVLIYLEIVRTQRNLLDEEAQKRQYMQYQLTLADKKATDAENRELALQEKHLKSENEQLKEYTSYLDKNEDELRRFKHDYQNILNGLRLSAEKGNVKDVVKQLDEYTNTQFDEKALRKYKGVNHIHVEELKSIAIAKLAKLYNLEINYSFGCDHDISEIPKNVNILDLTRIIGIAFDNAIEESQALIKQTGDKSLARVDAMFYQEDGDFEFEIRNKVRTQNTTVSIDRLSTEGYTTKREHSGIGLANVRKIATKYESDMMIDYKLKENEFLFSMVIVPNNMEDID